MLCDVTIEEGNYVINGFEPKIEGGNDLINGFEPKNERKHVKKVNLSYRYIDDLMCFNSKSLKVFISDIYSEQVTISETTKFTSVAFYLDLLCNVDKSRNMNSKLIYRHYELGFDIVNCSFMYRNMPI